MDKRDQERAKDWEKHISDPVAEKIAKEIGELFFKKADDSAVPLMFQPEEFFGICSIMATALTDVCYRPFLTYEEGQNSKLMGVYLMAGFCGIKLFQKEQTLVYGRFGGKIKETSVGQLKESALGAIEAVNKKINISPEADQVADFFLARLGRSLSDLPAKIDKKKLLRRKSKETLSSMMTWGYLFAREMTESGNI